MLITVSLQRQLVFTVKKKKTLLIVTLLINPPHPKCCLKSTVYGSCSTILTYNIEITMLEIEIIHESYLASSINYTVVLSTCGK